MDIKIALAGNPNCGKTTLFNALTGSNQFVGNWPGVTVEKKEGKLKGRKNVIITDLPGIYSLSPYTLEEVVARRNTEHSRRNEYRKKPLPYDAAYGTGHTRRYGSEHDGRRKEKRRQNRYKEIGKGTGRYRMRNIGS